MYRRFQNRRTVRAEFAESQVQQLLNDIKEFDYEKNNEKKFYCLQPLVVTEDKENGWVVIDGQQRLTTLFIILTCIEKMEE
jgi:uncharacterized protein with ParB-like and HNH nuclease domain